MPELGPEPADEFYPSLRCPQKPIRKLFCKAPGCATFLFFGSPLPASVLLLEVLDSLFFLESITQDQQQIVRQRDEVSLH